MTTSHLDRARSDSPNCDWPHEEDEWMAVETVADKQLLLPAQALEELGKVIAIFNKTEGFPEVLTGHVKTRAIKALDGSFSEGAKLRVQEVALGILLTIVKSKLKAEPLLKNPNDPNKKPLISAINELLAHIIHKKPYDGLKVDERNCLVYELGNRYSAI